MRLARAAGWPVVLWKYETPDLPVVKWGARTAVAVAVIIAVAMVTTYLKYKYLGGVTDEGEIIPAKKFPWTW